MNLIMVLITFFIACGLTWAMRFLALRNNIVDVPNERSAHSVSTPIGGGIAVIFTFLLGLGWLALQHLIPMNLFLALAGGSIALACLGYWDDLKALPIYVRLLVHFLAACWSLFWLNGFSIFQITHWEIVSNWFSTFVAAIGIVWFINLYNFMDGIDGLAASEGMLVTLCAGIAVSFLGESGIASICFVLFGALAGFLVWNWSPAKIFLGDVGSATLGFIFATLALYTAKFKLLPLIFWFVLLAIFICDASFTLLYRMLRGEKWYKAHREHAYQCLLNNGKSHHFITSAIQLINLLILVPIAWLILKMPHFAPALFLLMILSLGCLWIKIIRMKS